MHSILDFASKRKWPIAAAVVVMAGAGLVAATPNAPKSAIEKVWPCAEIFDRKTYQSELQLANDQRTQHHQWLPTPEEVHKALEAKESVDSCKETLDKLARILGKIHAK